MLVLCRVTHAPCLTARPCPAGVLVARVPTWQMRSLGLSASELLHYSVSVILQTADILSLPHYLNVGVEFAFSKVYPF